MTCDGISFRQRDSCKSAAEERRKFASGTAPGEQSRCSRLATRLSDAPSIHVEAPSSISRISAQSSRLRLCSMAVPGALDSAGPCRAEASKYAKQEISAWYTRTIWQPPGCGDSRHLATALRRLAEQLPPLRSSRICNRQVAAHSAGAGPRANEFQHPNRDFRCAASVAV